MLGYILVVVLNNLVEPDLKRHVPKFLLQVNDFLKKIIFTKLMKGPTIPNLLEGIKSRCLI